MNTMIKKFTVNAGECILHNQEVLNTIKQAFGDSMYDRLVNNKSVILEVMILCDTPTTIEVRYVYSQPTFPQDLIGDSVFTFPVNEISQIISTNAISGTIQLTVN